MVIWELLIRQISGIYNVEESKYMDKYEKNQCEFCREAWPCSSFKESIVSCYCILVFQKAFNSPSKKSNRFFLRLSYEQILQNRKKRVGIVYSVNIVNHSWSLIKIHARPCVVIHIHEIPGEKLKNEMAVSRQYWGHMELQSLLIWL